MTGADAVNSAKEFNSRLEVSGILLTKMDGDARGGAALSVRAVTGKPIKFVGIGEKLDAIEEFHPDRMAGRIIGSGDLMTVIERVQSVIDAEKAKELQEKLFSDKFTLNDFLNQLNLMKRMGSLKDLLSLVPGFGRQMKDVDFDEKDLNRVKAIIQSMTPRERERPDLIDGRRRLRIAKGCGQSPQDVNLLLKQFQDMRHMMKTLGGRVSTRIAGVFNPGASKEARKQKRQERKEERKRKRRR
jgi:signal recognition particle subunit SRP54